MSTIAIFIFDTPNDAHEALTQLHLNIAYGGFSKVGDEIRIESNCSDPSLACKICRAMGGETR